MTLMQTLLLICSVVAAHASPRPLLPSIAAQTLGTVDMPTTPGQTRSARTLFSVPGPKAARRAPRRRRNGGRCPRGKGFNFGRGQLQLPLPLPKSLVVADIDPKKGYLIRRFERDAYYLADGMFVAMAVVTRDGVILFDAPASMTDKIKPALAEVTDKPMTHLVYSHAHVDHIGGAAAITKDIDVTIVGAELVAERLRELGDMRRPVPTRIVKSGKVVSIGGVRMKFSSVPYVHGKTGTFIQIPAIRTVVVVDLLATGYAPFKDFEFTGDMNEFIKMHERLLRTSWEHLLSGHVDRMATRTDVERQLAYVNDVLKYTRKGLAIPQSEIVATVPEKYRSNPYVLANQVWVIAANHCYDNVVRKWKNVLAGVDVFAMTNCLRMYTYVALDLGM